MSVILKIYVRLFRPNHKEDFLLRLLTGDSVNVLDIGCGNNGVDKVRKYSNHKTSVFYSGLDIGDYNLKDNSKDKIDEYVITSPENFAESILQWEGKEDVVISSNNLEHCFDPDSVLVNISKSLKKGGTLYLSFPSEETVDFPKGFQGCLNYYDDATHQKILCWETVLNILSDNGMELVYTCKNYRPRLMRWFGRLTWFRVKRTKRVIPGTWEMFGFESIIWARKK